MTDEPPFDFGPMIDASISCFTVGFVLIENDNILPLGSGVLAEIDDIKGIVTCGHVVENLPKTGAFGIVHFGPRPHNVQRIKMESEYTIPNSIIFYDKSKPSEGPDIAFIPIPPIDFSKLEAFCSVISLNKQSERSDLPPPEGTTCIEAIAGIVDCMTPRATTHATSVSLSVEGLVNVGSVIKNAETSEFDYLTFKPTPSGDIALPSTYQGTSGGGIWKIYVKKKDDGNYELVQARLYGIAYFEKIIDEENTLGIIGHGPKTIYQKLVPKIKSKYSK